MSERPTNGSRFCGFFRVPEEDLNHPKPLDTATVQNGIVNNLESLYNGHFQFAVNYCVTGSNLYGGEWFAPGDDFADNPWFIESFGPFPLRRLKNGELAPLYIEIAGASHDPDLGPEDPYKVRIWVELRPAKDVRLPPDKTGFGDHVYRGYLDHADSSPQWRRLTVPANSQLSIDHLQPRNVNQYVTRNLREDSTPLGVSDMDDFFLDVYVGANATTSGLRGFNLVGLVARECPFLSGAV